MARKKKKATECEYCGNWDDQEETEAWHLMEHAMEKIFSLEQLLCKKGLITRRELDEQLEIDRDENEVMGLRLEQIANAPDRKRRAEDLKRRMEEGDKP